MRHENLSQQSERTRRHGQHNDHTIDGTPGHLKKYQSPPRTLYTDVRGLVCKCLGKQGCVGSSIEQVDSAHRSESQALQHLEL